MGSGAGACATCACADCMNLPAPGEATAPAATAAEPLSRSRLENREPVIPFLRSFPSRLIGPLQPRGGLHPEQLAVTRLDLLALLLDRGGVLAHGLEAAERFPPVGFLDLRMERSQLADIDDELLAFGREAVALEQPRRVRVRRILEDAVWSDHEWRPFGRIDDLDRTLLGLDLQHVVLVAVGHDRAFAEIELLGRIRRRLDLHDALLSQPLEIFPTDVARHLLGRGHDRAAVAG